MLPIQIDKVESIFNNAVENWRNNKGIGTTLIPPPIDDKIMIIKILLKIYNKKNDVNTLIIVNTFFDRKEIINTLNDYVDEETNIVFKNLLADNKIKVFTTSYINSNNMYNIPYLTILYHSESIHDDIFNLLAKSKFKLVVFNKFNLSKEDISKLYSICPLLNDFKQNEINELRTSTPVEEIQIGVTIPPDSDDFKLLSYYNDYINQSIAIFGSFDNIQYARVGNSDLKLTASQFCCNLAAENGWNDHLDMSVGINVQLDEVYNPNAIKERANDVYNKMRERRQFLSNYKAKLNEIYTIIKENENKRILIINKYADFATTVTKYINSKIGKEICATYHDQVEPIPAVTLDGEPILVKSGSLKGTQKIYHAQAQKSYNKCRFNENIINVLSTNNAPDKDLNIPIDIIVITSPECEDIQSYKYRLNNVSYPNEVIKLYTLFVRGSSEEKRLSNKTINENHTIVKKDESCDFIIVD